jgi:DNA-binding beta-propeller fold protein YncE
MKRFLRLGAILCLAIICLSCGDVFRPIIIPNPPKFPNPAAAHTVLTLSDNGTVNGGVETALVGSAMVIDVSGDTDVSQKNLGLVPVHAVQQSSTSVLVVNQSVPGANQESLTKLTYSGTSIGSTSTISLPTGSVPNFAATTETSQVYVSMPGYTPPSIAVVNTADNTIAETFQVGTSPVAIAETPDTTKLYVANYGDSTIGAYNTKDRSARGLSSQPTSPPIWLAARSDSQQVFVLEKNGTLAFLNTSTTAGPDTFAETSISVPGASYMWYDMILNRVYIPGNGALTIVDVSQSAPATLAVVTITTLPPTSRSAGDPCLNDTPGPLNIIGATSLPDGSRAYIGSYYIDSADNVCPQATVINATNFTVKTIIPIPGFPDATNPSTAYYVPTCTATRDQVGPTGNGFRLMMAAGGDSSRAYLSSCDGGNVNIIQTATDTYYFNLPAPYSSRNPIPPSAENPPQSPVFMIAGP